MMSKSEVIKTCKGAEDTLRGVISSLETLRDEIQLAFDSLSENAQGGERGERLDAAVSSLEDVLTNIETAADAVSDIEI